MVKQLDEEQNNANPLICEYTQYMIFVHCSKSAHAIGQNRSRVFWLPGNNESFECVITITHEKYALLKMARSKTSRKLYFKKNSVYF